MKYLKLAFLFAILVNMIGVKAYAHDIEVKNADGVTIYYNWINNKSELAVSYRGDTSSSYKREYTRDIVIPEFVTYNEQNYSVTSIGDHAFEYCAGLTSVNIPNSVTSIGQGAFWNCTGLASINIPNSVTSIGVFAFDCCPSLTSINIPNSVTSIGASAFEGCTGLTSVTIGNSVTSIGASAFEGCTGLTTINIPNSVTEICSNAFSDTGWYNAQTDGVLYLDNWLICYKGSLSSREITIINGTKGLADHAFYGCTGLTSINIPNSVVSIGEYAFYGCTGLTSINIPNSVTSISYHPFQNCSGLVSVTLNCKEVDSWFRGLTSIKNVILGENVTNIKSYAFDGCTGLTSINIPNSVTLIGVSAFEGCTGLTSINIPNSVTSIGVSAFYGCTGLTSVNIPNSVVSIDYNAFSGCSGLASVTLNCEKVGGWFSGLTSIKNVILGENVTNINYNAFEGCSGLASVTFNCEKVGRWFRGLTSIKNVILGENVTNIDGFAFSRCTGLTTINIPNSVVSIGEYAFYGCTGLTTINIPNSVVSIGEYAFYGCTGLSSINIPNSVVSIGEDAFEGCSGLASVTFNCEKVGRWFRGLTSIKNVILGENVTNIENVAFSGCTGLASINIPNSVTSIGDYVFRDCTSLASINIPNSVVSIGYNAFLDCSGLASVTLNCKEVDRWFRGLTSIKNVILGENVTNIDGFAFYGCTGLSSINIPNSVTSIGVGAFYNCTGLTSINIPNSVTSIGDDAFAACSGLVSVTLNCEKVGLWFRGLTSIKNVVFGDDVTSISKWAFQGCSGLISITSLIENPFAFYYLFDYDIYNVATLYVPVGTTEIYQSTAGWKNFKNIVELAGASIGVSVTDENGTDVTDKVSIVWYNAEGKEIGTGEKLNGVADSTEVYYSVLLNEVMGRMYREVHTQKVIVSAEPVTCQLEKIGRVKLEGRVSATDIDKTTMTVNIRQMLNGKWEQTYQMQTNEQGVFQLEVYDDETDIIITGEGYLDATIHRDGFNGNSDVGTIPVSLISGFAIAANITMQEATDAKEVTVWTDGLNNIEFTLNNTTKGTPITDFTLQNGSVIIKNGADVGDEISLTAKSKQGIFADATTSFTIEEGANVFDLQLTELGGFDATCAGSSNGSTLGYLYDSNGVLAAKGSYVGETLSLRHLQNGVYTLVSMGNSMLLGNMTRLSDLSATGLNEGTDYVTTRVVVVDGKLVAVNVDEVPQLDDTRFYYTNNNTYFSANKASVTAGDYLTLQAHVDFKPDFSDKTNNVILTIDLPGGCQIVENSVIANRQQVMYTLTNSRLTMSLSKEQYESQIRFCVVPMLNQDYTITAMASFDIDGQVTQPIGSARFEVKGLSLSTPKYAANTNITINGTAKGYSEVSIYDNDVLVGKTTSKADGSWTIECELYKPYSHSFHDIHAKITTENGLELTSEVQQVEYDKKNNVPEKVMMTFYNGWKKKNIDVEFNLLEGTTTPSSYPFYSGTDFTFLADFTRNDTTQIKNVNIKVLNSDGTVRTLPATFDDKQNKWVATTRYSSTNRLPQNVAVEYNVFFEEDSEDERKEPLLDEANILVSCAYDIYNYYNEKVDMTPVEDCEDYVTFECRTDENEQPLFYRIEGMDYAIAEEMMKTYQFVYSYNEDEISGFYTEIMDNGITVYAIDLTNNTAFKIMLYSTPTMSRAKINIENVMNAAKALKESVSSGQFLSGFLEYFGYVVNILSGIKEYCCVRGDFTNMCDIVIKYSDYLQKAREETFRYIVAKCPDGNYKLTQEKREQYSKAVQALDVSVTEFENQCYMYLDEYKNKLRSSVVTFICTLGLGKAISLLGTSGKFINGKLNGVVNKFFNKHFSSHVNAETTAGILASLLGTSAEFIQYKVDRIFDYKDFNSIKDNMLYWSTRECSVFLQTYKNMQDGMEQKYVKCGDDEIMDQVNNNGDYFKSKGSTPQIDPSGYVYEAVMSNRLEGVTTTCYQKVQVEDMYGDITEEAIVWNAEDYSQQNPLKTDATGFYRWDVPQGLWQVKFEKEGYETTYSEWLPVPPPQLDVNIAMKQNRQPEVKAAHAYQDAVEVEFDKYMMPEELNNYNITVIQDGNPVEGTISLLNEETTYTNNEESFASKVRFNAAQPFTAQEVTLIVSNRVKSYAGIRMQDDFSQTFKVEQEIKQILCDSLTVVDYGGKSTLTVAVLPASASKDKTLTVKTSSPMILGVETEQVIIGEDGTAEIIVSGELPGTAALTFSVEGTDKTALTIANVEQKVYTFVAKPIANIASGSVVDTGTQIILSCETDGVTIYYTIDGSCPCDNASRIKYDGTPIIINEGVTIKIIAVAPNGIESEVEEYVYTTKDEEDAVIKVPVTPTNTKDEYDISGRKVGRKTKGIIIRNNNGTNRKVLVK